MKGRRVWWLQALSGVLLVVLLGVHLFVNHFLAGGLLTYAAIAAYLRQPWALALEILFLLTVVTHALVGVRALVLDWGVSPAAERHITRGFAVLGAAAVAYGLWLFSRIVGW